MVAKPTQTPDWNTGLANQVEPSGAKKILGWTLNEVPPSSTFNWWQYRVYTWALWLNEKFYDLFYSVAGQLGISLKGSTGHGVLELQTNQADGSGVKLGGVQWTDKNSVASDKRAVSFEGELLGATANNRGGQLRMRLKRDASATGFPADDTIITPGGLGSDGLISLGGEVNRNIAMGSQTVTGQPCSSMRLVAGQAETVTADRVGGNIRLTAGRGTGTGGTINSAEDGDILFQNYRPGAVSGITLQSIHNSAKINRWSGLDVIGGSSNEYSTERLLPALALKTIASGSAPGGASFGASSGATLAIATAGNVDIAINEFFMLYVNLSAAAAGTYSLRSISTFSVRANTNIFGQLVYLSFENTGVGTKILKVIHRGSGTGAEIVTPDAIDLAFNVQTGGRKTLVLHAESTVRFRLISVF